MGERQGGAVLFSATRGVQGYSVLLHKAIKRPKGIHRRSLHHDSVLVCVCTGVYMYACVYMCVCVCVCACV